MWISLLYLHIKKKKRWFLYRPGFYCWTVWNSVQRELRISRWVFFLWGPGWQMSTILLGLRKMVCWTFQKIETFHLNVKRCYWTAGHLYWNYSVADSVFISTGFWGKRSKRALHQATWAGAVHHTGLWLQLEGFRATDLDGLMLTVSTCCAFQVEKNYPNKPGHSFVRHTNVATVVYKSAYITACQEVKTTALSRSIYAFNNSSMLLEVILGLSVS